MTPTCRFTPPGNAARIEDSKDDTAAAMAAFTLAVVGVELLLLDEPTAGINPAMIGQILDLIKRIVNEAGKTVIIIEHNMSVIMEIADFVYFMDDGRVETFGSPKDVLADERVREVYTGL